MKTIGRLGEKGRDGLTFLTKKGDDEYALKTFKKNRSTDKLKKEFEFLKLASEYGISPKPYNSWILNEETCLWEAPIERPNDGKHYNWDEENQNWKGRKEEE